ncbi:MAG TPA: hypothetical protein VHB27_10755 [Rhodopila sp.]|uniref:hypothetical protein n=1 Tax=Rhodopila sp. TaxID=2480087 RepID=UPI002C4A7E10|nr:hypothetical protein [Rhodopila sp.]HVY15703.1 hypothetical protein [Rhodopila sp.]
MATFIASQAQGAGGMFFFFLNAREPFDSPELERFGQALETAQIRYPNMTVSMLSTLLRVGLAPAERGSRVSVSDIVEGSPNQKYPTIARQIDLLGETGLGLIDKQSDAEDRRIRYVAVSRKGKLLLQELDLILAPGRKSRLDRQAVGRKAIAARSTR